MKYWPKDRFTHDDNKCYEVFRGTNDDGIKKTSKVYWWCLVYYGLMRTPEKLCFMMYKHVEVYENQQDLVPK